MKPHATPTTSQPDWQQLLAEWQQSSLSGAEFCKRQNIVYHQFMYWKKKLISPKSKSEPSKLSRFVRVNPVPLPAMDELAITLPGGIRITGLNTSNIELVQLLLTLR